MNQIMSPPGERPETDRAAAKPGASLSVKDFARLAIGRPRDWNLRKPAISRPRLKLSLIGPLVITASVAVSWRAFSGAVGEEGNASFGLFIGAASIVFMAWSFVLGVRFRFLEPFFNGLDSMYRAHRWAGTLAVVAMFLHTSSEAELLGGIRGASRSLAHDARNLASTGQVFLYILVGLSLVRWIPYRWWRWTHKLLIVPYVFACFHFYTATKTYANGSAWGWYFGIIMMAGIVGWTLRVVGKDAVFRGVRYTVSELERQGSTTMLRLAPKRRPLRHRAGQFAAIKIQARGLSEPHMFTIASGPESPDLRFYVRDLGDWTAKVQAADLVGTDVIVEGPFGRFQPFGKRPGPIVWVAAGVGITPFLSAVESLTPGQTGPKPVLLYCVRSRDDATALAQLERAHSDGRIDLRVYVSSEGLRLDHERLHEAAGMESMHGVHVAICGPLGLVRAASTAARSFGADDVETEAFDIRGGFGPDLSVPLAELLSR